MPDNGGHRELIDGQTIEMMPPTGGDNGSVAMELAGHLWNFVRGNNLGRMFTGRRAVPSIVRRVLS